MSTDSYQIEFELSEQDHTTLKRMADKAGMSVHDYTVKLIEDGIERLIQEGVIPRIDGERFIESLDVEE